VRFSPRTPWTNIQENENNNKICWQTKFVS
jgi:hypothetical protein